MEIKGTRGACPAERGIRDPEDKSSVGYRRFGIVTIEGILYFFSMNSLKCFATASAIDCSFLLPPLCLLTE
jgi:hypothetical protein